MKETVTIEKTICDICHAEMKEDLTGNGGALLLVDAKHLFYMVARAPEDACNENDIEMDVCHSCLGVIIAAVEQRVKHRS